MLSIDSASSPPYHSKKILYIRANDGRHEMSFNEFATHELEKNLKESLTE